MSYKSIDALQNALSELVFSHTESPKKAAGRALGTIIEIMSFYLIKTWGYEYETAIEKPLPEYANLDITHNVEFTLHRNKKIREVSRGDDSISSSRLFKDSGLSSPYTRLKTSRNFIKNGILKNACTFATTDKTFCNAYLGRDSHILMYELDNAPYAMFECKRVGVEEGNKKGPQTIEKAKQGSYVARTVSSIQRFRKSDGSVAGIVEHQGKIDFNDDYYHLIDEAIANKRNDILSRYILTVGIVSNHGNWFTSNNQNKEMKVLAQSYDWLLFLTDEGLANFVQDTLVKPKRGYEPIQRAFQNSYSSGKGNNRFTKTTMDLEADAIISQYFSRQIQRIESWFNVIAPHTGNISKLKDVLNKLRTLEGLA